MDKLKTSDLKRFLNGECEPEEAHKLMKWIYSDEARSIIEKDLVDFDNDSTNPNHEVYERLMSRIQEYESKISDESGNGSIRYISNGSKPSNKGLIIKIAASISIILAFSLIFFKTLSYEDAQIAESNIGGVIKISEPGMKKTVLLPDGTKIKLNSGSSIRFMPSSYDTLRVVELIEGEAYFDVFRDENHPFSVKVNDRMEVRILGTSFNVNSKDKESGVVAVKSGEVSVTNLNNGLSVQLVANEFTTISDYEIPQKEIIGNSDLMFGWTDKVLAFSNVEFREAISEISLWFGYEIIIEGDMSKFDNYSGIYENPTLTEVLLSLSHSYNLEYEITNKTVIIKERK